MGLKCMLLKAYFTDYIDSISYGWMIINCRQVLYLSAVL